MKNTNDPFMKLRIIIASIVLILILGGWAIYGYNFLNTSPIKILNKLSKIEKERINNYIDSINFNKENKYTIKISNNKNLYFYSNPKENKILLYNDNKYYNFINNNKMSTDSKDYKNILNSLINSFTLNYKLLDITKKKDDNKKYYIYSYSLNQLSPLTSTLKTDKVFIDSLKKSFNYNNKNIYQTLDKYSESSIGLNIITKGSKREIVYYNLKIDNLFDIYKNKDYISGYFLKYGFTYDKDLIIYTENNEYHAKIEKNNNSFDINKYQESSLEEVLSIIE